MALLLLALAALSALSALSACVSAQDPPLPRLIGQFPLDNAGFVESYAQNGGPASSAFNVYISTFNAAALTQKDASYVIRSAGDILGLADSWDQDLEVLGGEATASWPNYPVQVPSYLGGFEGVLQTSGFIPPGKTKGRLEVYNVDQNPNAGPWNIAGLDTEDYSYHWGVWKDVDGDGRDDLMAARFNVGNFGATTSELVWFKNPGGLGPAGENWSDWQQTTLLSGDAAPDVFIDFAQLTAAGTTYDVLVTGELWSQRIMLYYVPANVPGAWNIPNGILSTVVDDAPGTPFEAEWVDLNRDGQLEILSSSFIDAEADGGNLWLYTQPDDFRTDFWPKTNVASGFAPNNYIAGNLGNSIAPGKHRVFYPSADFESSGRKPLIALSSDDEGKFYIIHPDSEDPDDFSYTTYLLRDTEATIAGTLTVNDLDGDGFVEIVAAGYTAGQVYVYTYGP